MRSSIPGRVSHERRPRRRWIPTTLLVALGLVLAACGETPQSALNPQGPYAQTPDDLFRLVFWIAVVVFVIVQGLIIFAVVKFRAKPGDDTMPVQIHGNTRLEIMWTVIPAVILAAIAVPTVKAIFDLDRAPENALEVTVIGHRWWWEYQYPGLGPDGSDIITATELVMPVGRPVRLSMTAQEAGSADNAVIHSFWIPALAGKRDVVPGRINTLNMQADTAGRYLGQCAEYCGLSHANMRARAVALEPDAFDEWIANQAEPAVEPEPGSAAARGRDLFANQASSCVGCHAIKGIDGAQGRVGPNLTHLASREEFAGAIFELNEENLFKWLKDPPGQKPMQPENNIGMPNLGLSDQEAQDLVAYLLTLK